MSELESKVVPEPVVSIVRYHAVVLGFFVITLVAQVLLARQYITLLPASLHGLLQTIFVLFFAVQGALQVSTIPLAMIFMVGWLYLANKQVKVRQLYPIVVIAMTPLLAFMFFSLAYLLAARGIEPGVREKMVAISRTLEAEMSGTNDPTKMNPAQMQELGGLLKADLSRQRQPIDRLVPLPLALCCLLCGWLLSSRLGVGKIHAYLMPITFVVFVGLTRWAMASPSVEFMEKFKGMAQP